MTKRHSADQLDALRTGYETASLRKKRIAHNRVAALAAVENLVAQGHKKLDAREAVAAQLRRDGVRGLSVASLSRCEAAVRGYHPTYWPAVLIPQNWGTEKRIPEATRSAAVASLASGESIAKVARLYRISLRTVARYADEAGIARLSPRLGHKSPLVPQETRCAIVADLVAGRTRTATAAFHGVGRQTVQDLARAAGLTKPRAGKAPATGSGQ